MILGNLCTRGCGFCSVPKGSAAKREFFLDPDEPAQVANMAAELGLRYVVITSVNRDDLSDGGSHHFADTVRQVRRSLPEARVEVLYPDFDGNFDAVARVLDAGPHVYNHNMETVSRLSSRAPAGGLSPVAGGAAFCQATSSGSLNEIRPYGWTWRDTRRSSPASA